VAASRPPGGQHQFLACGSGPEVRPYGTFSAGFATMGQTFGPEQGYGWIFATTSSAARVAMPFPCGEGR
jgi:hypothetical protein